MPRLPPPPDLDWSGPAPRSRDKDDVYFSADGLAEKRHVFLVGCGLPEAWAGREQFTVGELGFGSGLSFIALWDLWRKHRPSPTARLNVLLFEGALMPAINAGRVQVYCAGDELLELSKILLPRWPWRARGVQRIVLPDGVALTIHVDDISASLPEARASVDAWFLDGFAPAKNPEMWSADVMRHVARLSAPGARVASYAVAGDVRRNLEAVGFAVEKKPGFGRKKERLEAYLPGATAPRAGPKRVSIIGAGIAGACAARAFLDRGCEVTVIDKGPAPGAGASGNPLALVMPRLDAADGPAARALVEAYIRAWTFYSAMPLEAADEIDVTHRPRNDTERQRFTKLLADPPLDGEWLQPIDPADPGAGMRHLCAPAVNPSVALPLLLQGAKLRFNTEIRSLDEIDADLVVVCAGMGVIGIEGVAAPPVTGRLGQLECAPSSAEEPNGIADGGYVVEAFGKIVFGATFEEAKGEPQVSEAARAQNLETLARLRPDLKPEKIVSRAAIRATTPDRLPFAGPPPKNEKALDADPAPSKSIRLIGGLGARGFLWGPLLAELVASEAFGEPWPVEASVAQVLDPGRFAHRAEKRGG